MGFFGVVERPESFKSQMAKGLGEGFSQGMSEALKGAIESYRNKSLINQVEGMGQDTSSSPGNEKSYPSLQRQPQEPSLQTTSPLEKKDPFAKARTYASLGKHELARVAMEEAKIGEKRQMAREERNAIPQKEYMQHSAKENSKFLDEVAQVEKDLPNTEFSLAMIEDSLGDAGKWAAARDWIGEKVGYKGFRSAAGAELDSGVKNYFLGDLTSIKGGRANVFLEKQIRDAYMAAGQDPISNQKILLGMKMKEKINKLKVAKTRELEDYFIKKDGYLPSNFKAMVNNSLKDEIIPIEKEAIDSLHKMTKIQGERDKIFRAYLKDGETLMMDPEGNPFAVKNKEVAKYREQGYIPMGKK